jgi:hypothetical protein
MYTPLASRWYVPDERFAFAQVVGRFRHGRLASGRSGTIL